MMNPFGVDTSEGFPSVLEMLKIGGALGGLIKEKPLQSMGVPVGGAIGDALSTGAPEIEGSGAIPPIGSFLSPDTGGIAPPPGNPIRRAAGPQGELAPGGFTPDDGGDAFAPGAAPTPADPRNPLSGVQAPAAPKAQTVRSPAAPTARPISDTGILQALSSAGGQPVDVLRLLEALGNEGA